MLDGIVDPASSAFLIIYQSLGDNKLLAWAFISFLNIVFKPAIDIRYKKNEIVSHNKDSINATVVNNIAEIQNLISDEEVIAIDEAQFFDETLISLCNDLANKGKRIIICGLDMDYLGVPFGIMPSLMAISDSITKLHAICSDCGDTANYSYRKTIDQDRIVIGANYFVDGVMGSTRGVDKIGIKVGDLEDD